MRLRRIVVHGPSMRPALEPGDRLVVMATRRIAPGAMVALRDPTDADRTVVKRVAERHPDGSLTVLGDDPAASTDSRQYGPVPPDRIVGRVVYRYAPSDRAGRIRYPRRRGRFPQ